MEAVVLRTKPEADKWLHLTSRVAALSKDALGKIHTFLRRELNLAESDGEKSAETVDRVCQTTLEAFWTENVREEEGFERTDSMFKGLGSGCTASFLVKN